MNKRKIFAICFGALLLGCIFIFVSLIAPKPEYVQRMRQKSAYGALTTALLVGLSDYYHEHSSYPKKLKDINIEYHDGANEELLKQFTYVSGENSCYFSYEHSSLSGKDTYTEKFSFGDGFYLSQIFINGELTYQYKHDLKK